MLHLRSMIVFAAGGLLALGCYGPMPPSDQSEVQILQPRTAMKTCDVPASFGALKGVWQERLLFEDAAGMLRSVDSACQVRHTIGRQ